MPGCPEASTPSQRPCEGPRRSTCGLIARIYAVSYHRTVSEFERPLVARLVDDLTRHGSRLILGVTGPRQVGKTTMIRQALRRLARDGTPSLYVGVDNPEAEGALLRPGAAEPFPIRLGRIRDTAWLVRVWNKARDEARRSAGGFILALDEIQYVEGWSRALKGLWDRDRWSAGWREREHDTPRVIVAGSAPWTILTGMHESLAGRFLPFPVRHWSFAEMAAAFGVTLEQYLFFGGYPGAAPLMGDVEAWRRFIRDGIVAPSVDRDIVALTRIDKPALMRRLLDLVPHYSGRILSLNKMLGQLQDAGNTATLAHYLDLLSDAGLVAGLSRYTKEPYFGRASSPRLNVLNTALMTASTDYDFDGARADRTFWGRLTESAVGAHLLNTHRRGEVRYWRDERSREVDFVLSRGPHVLAIEVKSGARPGFAGGLKAFRRRVGDARALLVHGSGAADAPLLPAPPATGYTDDSVRRASLREFLSEPAEHWLEPDFGGVREPLAACGGTAETRQDPVAPQHPAARAEVDAGVATEARIDPAGRWATAEREDYVEELRRQRDALLGGNCTGFLLHHFARAYWGESVPAPGEDPAARLTRDLDSDQALVGAALEALRGSVTRSELPTLAEIVRFDETDEWSMLTLPVLAGLNERDRAGEDLPAVLDEEGLLRAVAFHLLAPGAATDEDPAWYLGLLGRRPDIVARALETVSRSRIRRRARATRHLYEMTHDDRYAEVAPRVAEPLLRAFPRRCTSPQVSALCCVLWAAVRYLPGAELEDGVRHRTDPVRGGRGMDQAQRAAWLGAGLALRPESYGRVVVAFVEGGRSARVAHLVRFLAAPVVSAGFGDWPPRILAALIATFGARSDPEWSTLDLDHAPLRMPSEREVGELQAGALVRRWIRLLAGGQGPESLQALESLAHDFRLHAWRGVLAERSRPLAPHPFARGRGPERERVCG